MIFSFFLKKKPNFCRSIDGRAKRSVKEFAEKHVLGDPVAGNFFQAKYDDYVPILYKQLGV